MKLSPDVVLKLLDQQDATVEWFFNDELVAKTRIDEDFVYTAPGAGALRAYFVHGESRTEIQLGHPLNHLNMAGTQQISIALTIDGEAE